MGGIFGRPLFQQGGAILDRDLIIIGVDVAKGHEPMAISTKFHKRRLQRGFNPHDLGEVDVSFKLFSRRGFNVERIQLRSVHHNHSGFFGLGGIDKQPFYHRKPSP